MKNEDYSATLNTVLHSKQKGTEALKWAYNDAAKTPFDAGQVVSGVTQLATSGLDYTKYLNPLGDAAAAMNKPLEQAIFAMSKLKSGQLGMGVDMFRDFGVSNQDWMKAGATFSKNGELQVSDPQKAVDMVTNIINSKYGGLMNEKSNTAGGMISNIGDTFASMGRGLAGIDDNGQIMKGGLFDNFKKQLAVIMPLLDKIKASGAFSQLQKEIGNLATEGGNKLTEFLKGFENPNKIKEYKAAFKQFMEDVKAGWGIAKEFGSAIAGVAKTLEPLIKTVAAHPKLFVGLFAGFEAGKGVSSIKKNFKDIKKEIGALLTSARTFKSGFKGVFKNIVSIASGPLKSVAKVFKTAGKGILTFVKSIPKGLSKVVGTIKSWVGVIGNVLKNNLLKTVKNVAKGIINVVKPVFAFLAANPVVLIIMGIIAVVILLYEAWKHNWGGIQDKTKAVIDFCKTKIESIKETFDSVKEKCKEFKEKICEYWDNIKTFFAHPIKGTVDIVKNISDKISGKDPGKNALGTNYWKGGLTWVGEHGPELVNLSKGSSIYSNRDSNSMLGGVVIAKLADQIVVREDADIDKIVTKLVKKLNEIEPNVA
ncbi:hypothetical protein [Clostridium sp. JN-9]|uniref:hypothetical protein n=1 Tax=Clostridium sp. JN-9 TaxID=2507159 RepID=UPI000FFE233A|nr:hypothetical protein [Clostridium sp. JN-9]QAT40831.1 hypothetical protein EQM05_11475 [Clostridium sp. JN-9]